jgi:hypothetical protein
MAITMAALIPWLTCDHLSRGLSQVDLNIPLFTANPLDLSVTLELDSEIAITKDFFYEKLVLEVDALPLAVSVDTEFKVRLRCQLTSPAS